MVKNKWSCSQCTFENGNRDLKCVLCHCTRRIVDEDELFKPSYLSSEVEKWECSNCNYLNWPKILRCALCMWERELSYSAQNYHHLTYSPSSTAEQKWSCSVCTLLNWPKSMFCVVCKTPRRKERVFCDAEKCSNVTRCWLEACVGAVNNEVEPVNFYIHQFSGVLEPLMRTTSNFDSETLAQMLDVPLETGQSLMCLSKKFSSTKVVEYLCKVYKSMDRYLPISSEKKKTPCQINEVPARQLRDRFAEALETSQQQQLHPLIANTFTFFVLPQDLYRLHPYAQNVLISNIVDFNATEELEVREMVINWWCESVKLSGNGKFDNFSPDLLHNTGETLHYSGLGNCLYVLWNRSCGDCLLDSVMQSACGVLDCEQTLRNLMATHLQRYSNFYYRRWREYETGKASDMGYEIDTMQLHKDWNNILAISNRPGESLEQIHIFILANVFRRPIIVYSIKFIRNYRNEEIGLANYQGVYLPLMLKNSLCNKNPLVLGYTRGHFCSLVGLESVSNLERFNVPDNVGLVPLSFISDNGMVYSDEVNDCMGFCDDNRYLQPYVDWQVQRQVLARAYLERYLSSSTRLLEQGERSLVTEPSDDVKTHSASVTNQLNSPAYDCQRHVIYVPLYDYNGNLMPIRYHSLHEKFGGSMNCLEEWLNVCTNKFDLPLVKLQWIGGKKSSVPASSFINSWLEHYRDLDDLQRISTMHEL